MDYSLTPFSSGDELLTRNVLTLLENDRVDALFWHIREEY